MTAWARSRTESLSKMLVMRFLTVERLMSRAREIPVLSRPVGQQAPHLDLARGQSVPAREFRQRAPGART